MAFRWKQYGDRTPDDYGMVPPEIGEQRAVSMQGYTPNSAFAPVNNAPAVSASAAMAGYRPIDSYAPGNAFNPPQGYGRGMAPDNMDAYGQYRADASREAADAENRAIIEGEINKLQAQLNSIDARIAQIDKEVPGIGGNEWEIAAKRAEVGDYAAYDNIVNRGQNRIASANSAADGIKNELYNAAKLTWGLKAKNSDDREAARNQIEVALVKAEEAAVKNGTELPQIYYDLKSKLDEIDAEGSGNDAEGILNGEQWENKVYTAVKDGTYDKAMEKEALKFVADYPNDPRSKEIAKIVDDNKGNTKEARAEAARQKKAAKNLYDEAKNMSKDDLFKWYHKLSDKQRKLLEDNGYKVDLGKGTIQ